MSRPGIAKDNIMDSPKILKNFLKTRPILEKEGKVFIDISEDGQFFRIRVNYADKSEGLMGLDMHQLYSLKRTLDQMQEQGLFNKTVREVAEGNFELEKEDHQNEKIDDKPPG